MTTTLLYFTAYILNPLQLVASGVAAYRVELYSSTFVNGANLPTKICHYNETSNEYRGDRICNNAIGAAVSTVIVAVVLMIIDLLIPCIDTAVSDPPLFLILTSLLSTHYSLHSQLQIPYITHAHLHGHIQQLYILIYDYVYMYVSKTFTRLCLEELL